MLRLGQRGTITPAFGINWSINGVWIVKKSAAPEFAE